MRPTPDGHALFDRLCLLRELYAHRGPRDRESVMSVADALRYAEALLARSIASTV